MKAPVDHIEGQTADIGDDVEHDVNAGPDEVGEEESGSLFPDAMEEKTIDDDADDNYDKVYVAVPG